ncbi:parathyroid hormone 2 receptor-like [Mya arenaria]|uniref:parathyroid hormone 2 receptor-like n=1 Tax=Mya arenaria TaxID=6604 RepID=UPI0022E2D87A|nr:parathyroid hormone 2 receptor-like [Mya arenaria]
MTIRFALTITVLMTTILDYSLQEIVYMTSEEQVRARVLKAWECADLMNVTHANETDPPSCPVIWDNIMCWPLTPGGSRAQQPCPNYINKFKTHEFASRECLLNGTWHDPRPGKNTETGWTNYSLCTSNENRSSPIHNTSNKSPKIIVLMKEHQAAFRTMYNFGFSLSLVSLLLAVFIMIYFRKLHCSRNYIHMNLFIAFILRAVTNTVRENAFVHNLGFPMDVELQPNGEVVFTDGPHWECRLFYALHNYVLMASYMWIFVEAVYIHMVIFIAVFTEKIKVIWYILFGWMFPLPFVIAWAVARIYLYNQYCWSLNDNQLILITQIPIYITIVVNFLFFINIVRLLLTKMNAVPQSNTNRYRTLAKSLVVLILLFGVHFIIATLPADDIDPEGTISFVLLIIEMFFNSYQGLFIAVLLCFTNAEVRTEIKKSWNRLNLRRCSNVSRTSQHNHRRSFSTTGTKVSEISRLNSLNKRYACGRKSSVSDLEQTVPLSNSLVRPSGSKDCDITIESKTIDKPDNDKRATANGHLAFNPDEFELKINVVNIECTSRDGLSRNTTSLDIETLKNGCTINTEIILNNNVHATESEERENEEGIVFMDGSQT